MGRDFMIKKKRITFDLEYMQMSLPLFIVIMKVILFIN